MLLLFPSISKALVFAVGGNELRQTFISLWSYSPAEIGGDIFYFRDFPAGSWKRCFNIGMSRSMLMKIFSIKLKERDQVSAKSAVLIVPGRFTVLYIDNFTGNESVPTLISFCECHPGGLFIPFSIFTILTVIFSVFRFALIIPLLNVLFNPNQDNTILSAPAFYVNRFSPGCIYWMKCTPEINQPGVCLILYYIYYCLCRIAH